MDTSKYQIAQTGRNEVVAKNHSFSVPFYCVALITIFSVYTTHLLILYTTNLFKLVVCVRRSERYTCKFLFLLLGITFAACHNLFVRFDFLDQPGGESLFVEIAIEIEEFAYRFLEGMLHIRIMHRLQSNAKEFTEARELCAQPYPRVTILILYHRQ